MNRRQKLFVGILILLFMLSSGFLIYMLSGHGNWTIYTSYLQEPQQIYKMETGIIKTLSEFQSGEDVSIRYDFENHVVNEVWDSTLNQWVMLDITNNYYWIDENGKPLSVLEIRDRLEKQLFCTPVSPSDDLHDLERSLHQNYDNVLYIAKNMIYMYYCTNYSTGETEQFYSLMPVAFAGKEDEHLIIVSQESIEAAPFNEKLRFNLY